MVESGTNRVAVSLLDDGAMPSIPVMERWKDVYARLSTQEAMLMEVEENVTAGLAGTANAMMTVVESMESCVRRVREEVRLYYVEGALPEGGGRPSSSEGDAKGVKDGLVAREKVAVSGQGETAGSDEETKFVESEPKEGRQEVLNVMEKGSIARNGEEGGSLLSPSAEHAVEPWSSPPTPLPSPRPVFRAEGCSSSLSSVAERVQHESMASLSIHSRSSASTMSSRSVASHMDKGVERNVWLMEDSKPMSPPISPQLHGSSSSCFTSTSTCFSCIPFASTSSFHSLEDVLCFLVRLLLHTQDDLNVLRNGMLSVLELVQQHELDFSEFLSSRSFQRRVSSLSSSSSSFTSEFIEGN